MYLPCISQLQTWLWQRLNRETGPSLRPVSRLSEARSSEQLHRQPGWAGSLSSVHGWSWAQGRMGERREAPPGPAGGRVPTSLQPGGWGGKLSPSADLSGRRSQVPRCPLGTRCKNAVCSDRWAVCSKAGFTFPEGTAELRSWSLPVSPRAQPS